MPQITKESDSSYKIEFGKYHTHFIHVVDEKENSDLWNINGIFCGADEVVGTGTDIVGPICEVNQADFMGGVHGDEINKVLFITCDGVQWNGALTKASAIQIVMNSELYRVDSKKHIYNRYVTITFTENRIHIINRHECITSDSIIKCAPIGGLFGIRNTYLTAVSMPNFFSSKPLYDTVNNHSKDNVSGILYWKNGSIEVRNITGKERSSFSGYVHVFTNEVPIRSKIYLAVIKEKEGGTPIKKGESILGEFEYLLR